MSFANRLAQMQDEHIRLSVLRLLESQAGYHANDSVLHQAVNQMALACTRDQMRGHLTWLEEQRLVTLAKPAETLIVATLTERGAEVASGRSIVDGVQRPSPKGD